MRLLIAAAVTAVGTLLLSTSAEAKTVDWSTPADLERAFCPREDCDKPMDSAKVKWGQGIARQVLVGSASVRFGPFHAHQTVRSPLVTHFRVEVWARTIDSAILSGSTSGQFSLLATGGIDLRKNEDAQDFFVTATLPAVFDAIRLRATINNTQAIALYPPECDDVAADGACMAASVDPTGILLPHFLPATIIYEPPGACSFAGLTATSVAGTTLAIATSRDDASHTLVDPGQIATSLFNDPKGDFTEHKLSATTRMSRITLTQSEGYGTALYTNGGPACVGIRPADCSLHRGLGEGDLFVLLKNPRVLYWSTEGLANFVFAPSLRSPGPSYEVLRVFAWQLKDPAFRSSIGMSDQEATTLLALDPFTRMSNLPPSGAIHLSKRFVAAGPVESAPPNDPATHCLSLEIVKSLDQGLCDQFSSTSDATDNSDLLLHVLITGLAYVFAFSSGDVATAVAGEKIG